MPHYNGKDAKMDWLVVTNLTKRYEKGKFALNRVSLTVPSSNGIFALIGRNGAGKTTLVRILATQLSPTSGSAHINGIDVVKEPEKLREIIACVPQEARTINWTTPKQFVYAYLLWRGYSFKEAAKRAVDSLKRLGIGGYMDTASRKLSGGTKRKVLVATVISSEAKIIFLDEPTTGLDPLSRNELWEKLAELKKDHFIFLTTHYLEEAEKLADRIAILENGKIMAQGTLDDLRRMVKYPYSITVLSQHKVQKPKHGEMIIGIDGYSQILTTEREAKEIARKLVGKGVKFSMNPIALDDIFYHIVRKPVEEEGNYDEEEWA